MIDARVLAVSFLLSVLVDCANCSHSNASSAAFLMLCMCFAIGMHPKDVFHGTLYLRTHTLLCG